jgi:hypothetical protein
LLLTTPVFPNLQKKARAACKAARAYLILPIYNVTDNRAGRHTKKITCNALVQAGRDVMGKPLVFV